MSQSSYEFYTSLFGVYLTVVQIILFIVLWNIFHYPTHEKKSLAAAGLFAAANIVMKLLPDMPSWNRYIISAFLVLGYGIAVYKKRLEKPVFILLLFYNFHSMSFLITNSIYLYIVNKLFQGLDVCSADYMMQMYRKTVVSQVWFVLAYTILLIFMVGIVRKIIKRQFSMQWYDVIFLSAFNIVGSMLSKVVTDLSVVQIEDRVFLLFDDRKEMIWKMPLIAICVCVGEISAIYIYHKYKGLLEERQKHFVEEQQIKAMKRRLEEAQNFYGSIRKVRHEMKNHMINIKGMVEGEKYKEVENYIEKLDETIQSLDYQYNTGNAVTDVIINDKYRKAVRIGITFQVNFYYDETNAIPVFDIGIILNNLLDNAIEACEKVITERRYIALNLKRKHYFLLIEVENSFDGELRWAEGSAVLLTTKQNKLPDILMEHGIGLKNVKDVADRYLGDMRIKVQGNIFKVTVMLQQKEENHESNNTNGK